MEKNITTYEEYIKDLPPKQKEMIEELYTVFMSTIPNVKVKISWGMPTFYTTKNIIHCAAFKHHVGVYPGGSITTIFADRLKDYKTSKGSIQLPLDKEIPIELISDIVNYLVKEQQ